MSGEDTGVADDPGGDPTSVPVGIEPDRVTRWMEANVDGVSPPLSFSLIAGGHSNLTYRVEDSRGRALVLRRPPTGHVLATAHDMAREHRIVTAVGRSDVPVPTTLGLCTDETVNGAPFYVMNFVEGAVLHDEETAAGIDASERRSIGFHLVEVLAQLHSVDPDRVGLGELARRDGYIARQLKRWARQWESSKTRDLAEMDDSHRLLSERLPEQIGTAIVHGDYRLGNMITGGGQVRAVLDWELCTLGDAMADVGYLMNNWVAPGELPSGTSSPTLAGGFPSRRELLDRYAELSGRDVGQVDYYRAFSYWRLAAIVEGVLNRYLHGAMGDTEDVDLDLFRSQVETLATSAMEFLES